MNTKEDILKINNIILSAFPDNQKILNFIKSENKLCKNDTNKKLSKQKKNISGKTKRTVKPKKTALITTALTHLKNKKYGSAYYELVNLLKKNPNDISIIKLIVSILLNLEAYDIITDNFIDKLLPYINKDSESLELTAHTYFSIPEYYQKAIPLYEKLIKKYPNKNKDYNYRLAFMYERVYQDKHLDLQLKHLKEALEENCNKNLIYTFLAKLNYRLGNKPECKKYLDKMMKNNPSAQNIVSYGRFLMKEGLIEEGYDLYRKRFDTGHVAYPKSLLPEKRWNGIDSLTDKTVIIHYEQGFGDSVMFSRYIPEISKLAKKTIFVVQKNLIPLFKSSGFDKYCEILSHEADVNPNIQLENTNRSIMYSAGTGMSKIPHDFHIPLMDTPYLMKESVNKMNHSSGYLQTNKEKINEYKKQYISENNKIKIGLAYHGTKESIVTYRDISVKEFIPILKMKNVECYSFQADAYAQELYELDKNLIIIDLGKTFNNFEDTACAIECMDVIISTDNVVMNLAGALGKKTYGLFNVYTESRWYKTEGNDIGWYKSVRPFRARTFNDWQNVIKDVQQALIEDFNL